ncbi:chloroplast sensor kinase, chloroplastic-like [Chenopodium quinoa]|uniref:chloroplast sensor kinase, chloroplastic-like n=1 Tax=Chenopodium quinoa TaxID=63459 RepID=UPI000B78CA1B|nr:chloroplast sensor kinase, chloroplastic-like [Chenopodium quinoa]
MMHLLSAIPPQHSSLSNPSFFCSNSNPFHHNHSQKPQICCFKCYSFFPIHQKPPFLANSSSSSTSTATLRYVNNPILEEEEGGEWVPSASALASVIRKASSSPIEFTQEIERDPKSQGIILPSPDFQKLCLDQLTLFRRIVDPSALLSVYVRPAGSYVMDRLELRRVTFYPTVDGSDIVILVGNFSVPAGLRGAEAALSNMQAEAIPECRSVVFPMVRHPFVVGFLVAELPGVELEKGPHDASHLPSPEECYALPPKFDSKAPDIPSCGGNPLTCFNLSADQRLNAINISHSLATAYVMDQKAMLLQQTSWQNNIRMSNLVEQIRGPLSSIRSLSKLLAVQIKRSEIAHDIVEDIMVQGDHIRDTLEQLQDAVLLTKANIMRFNEESLKKMDGSSYAQPEMRTFKLPKDVPTHPPTDKIRDSDQQRSLSLAIKDLEMPMPPLALAPVQQHSIRPCNVSDIVVDLVGAAQPLALNQKRRLELCEFSQYLPVAIEEPALRQALSNLIEGALLRTHVGGKVEIVSIGAPAGGALVVIDDDGPDMHYMTQMHSLTPFGAELFSDQMMEDNMTWNFVAGLTVAREILESYGCVVRVISPRNTDAALGTGGTRVEIWLPSSTPYNHSPAADGA